MRRTLEWNREVIGRVRGCLAMLIFLVAAVWVAKEPGCGHAAPDLDPTTHGPQYRHPSGWGDDDPVKVDMGDGSQLVTTWREARPYYERGDVESLKTILRIRAAEAAAGTTDQENGK